MASAATAVSFVLAVLVAFPCGALAPTDFPSPLAGPGIAKLKRSQYKKIDRAWREFLAGNHAESRKRAQRVADLAPTRLLQFQVLLQEGNFDDMADLRSFCTQQPDYAAAWITLSIAAETAGLEAEAITNAERGGGLWPEPPWLSRAGDLYQRWVDDRITNAARLVEAGESNEAMAELQAARELDPGRQDAALIVAEILFANEQIPEAETILSEISDLPDAAFLQGRIAETRHAWQTAMERYASLPVGFPGRDAALGRTKIQWRLSVLPDYARSSMTAEGLTRGDLAVTLVSVRPELETLPGDSVPVMSDIVDFPGQREIITVVRLGIMRADRRDHRFFPDAAVDPDTVRAAIQRTRALLGLTAPVWCSESDVLGSSCISISPTPSGKAVVQAVLDHQPGASR
jgi:tetratricopeptide (TPR) repeat protein